VATTWPARRTWVFARLRVASHSKPAVTRWRVTGRGPVSSVMRARRSSASYAKVASGVPASSAEVSRPRASCVSTGAEYPLETQLVVRTHPDPGSRAGIDNGITPEGFGGTGVNLGTAQVLAILFIPEGTPDSEYYIRARRILRTYAGDSSPQVLGALSLEADDIVIEVLPPDPDDQRTPLEAFFKESGTTYDSSGDPTEIYPYPKLLLNLPGGNSGEPNLPVPSAADIILEYPEHIAIKDVFEEQHLGRESLITWQDFPGFGDGGGLLRIRYLSMEHDAEVFQLAIAFEPDPANYTRIEQTEIDTYFEIEDEVFGVETAYYDANGNELDFTGSAAPPWLGPIR